MNSYLTGLERVIWYATCALLGEIVLAWAPLLGRGAWFVQLVGSEKLEIAVVEKGERYVGL